MMPAVDDLHPLICSEMTTSCTHTVFCCRSAEDAFSFNLEHDVHGLDRKTRLKTSLPNARIPVQMSVCQGYLGLEVDICWENHD
jgi:hypothetical protein